MSTQKKAKSKLPTNLLLGIAILLLAAVVVGVWLTRPGSGEQSGALPREVSVAEADALVKDGALLLDVREPAEWEDFHVPGAVLIPLGELESRLAEVPRDRQVVVICRSGNRSQSGRDILLQAGYENATSVAGGVTEWRAAGLPVVSGP